MRASIQGIAIILLLVIFLVPQSALAYSPPFQAIPIMLISIGIIPFLVGYGVNSFFLRRIRINYILKLLLTIIVSQMILFAYYFYIIGSTLRFSIMIIAPFVIIFLINTVAGFKTVEKNKGAFKFGFLYIFLISPIVVMAAFSIMYIPSVSYQETFTYSPDDGFFELNEIYNLSAGQVTTINGKLAFNAYDFIVYDNQKYGIQYDDVSRPTDINNKLAYVATYWTSGPVVNDVFIVYDGDEIGRDYDFATMPTEIDGKLVFQGGNNCSIVYYSPGNCAEYFIEFNGEKHGIQYDDVSSPTSVNEKLAYRAALVTESENLGHGIYHKEYKFFVVYDGKEYGKQYEDTGVPIEVNGKLAYSAKTHDGRNVIVLDGKEVVSTYEELSDITEINGKLAYVKSGGGWFFSIPIYTKTVIYDGQEFGLEYNEAYRPTEVNGKLSYFVKRGDNDFIVYDGKEIGKGYEDIISIGEINGNLVFTAKTLKNNAWRYVVVIES